MNLWTPCGFATDLLNGNNYFTSCCKAQRGTKFKMGSSIWQLLHQLFKQLYLILHMSSLPVWFVHFISMLNICSSGLCLYSKRTCIFFLTGMICTFGVSGRWELASGLQPCCGSCWWDPSPADSVLSEKCYQLQNTDLF